MGRVGLARVHQRALFLALHARAGKTEPSNCRAFGPNLHHGVAGKPLIFHVLARDAYANQRLAGGDAFKVRVQALSAFNAEFAQHIKKVRPTPQPKGRPPACGRAVEQQRAAVPPPAASACAAHAAR